MKKVKVLHISNTDFFINKLMLNKLIGLKNRGYVIHAMAPRGEHEKVINKHIKFYHLPLTREVSIISDLKCIYMLTKFLIKQKYDIVHTHSSKAGIIGRIAAKLSRTPIIIHTAHGLPFYEGQKKINFHLCKLIERGVGLITDAILSQNYEDYQKIIDCKICNKDKAFFEGNGVNIHNLDYIYRNVDKDGLKKELNIENKIIIGLYARLEPVKGHLFFLDSFKKVVQKYPNIVCLMAGANFGFDSSYEKRVIDKIYDLGLENNVKLLGFRDDIYSILAITDILVLPSKKEGIPRIVMEAMTYKIPVIGTNVLGTREIVQDNFNGYLVEYGNVKQLETAIIHLLKNNDLRKVMGENGRNTIVTKFDEEKVIQRIDEVYKKLLKMTLQ